MKIKMKCKVSTCQSKHVQTISICKQVHNMEDFAKPDCLFCGPLLWSTPDFSDVNRFKPDCSFAYTFIEPDSEP